MSLLLIDGLQRHFGAREVLHNASLRIEAGEKVGCVGKNGTGKTTLFRLIEGEDKPDGGTIRIARGSRVGYVAQRPRFEGGVTVREYVSTGLNEVHAVARELSDIEHLLAENTNADQEKLLHRHGALTERMGFLDGWEADRRVEAVLSGIGLATSLWDREAATLSGGERSRTAMARELVAVPDLLLLDEPTNHLDLAGIEWLEAYLVDMHSAVLLVSHDRRLLSRLVTTIVEIEGGRIERYPGNYPTYLQLKEERYEADLKAFKDQREVIRKEDAFIKKHMGSQRTGEAKGRRKRLKRVVRLQEPHLDVRRPSIKLPVLEAGAAQVFEVEDMAVGYDGIPLVDGITLAVTRGERVGIVGPNGSGKTTLLRVLAGRADALSGDVKRGRKAVCAYFDQDTDDLRNDGTVYEEVRRIMPLMTDLEIRSFLARCLFRGKAVDTPVTELSGGERGRLTLGRLVLQAPSWLALDEPTNHLDLAGRTALEEMLSAFQGALVCISHDRELLDGLCTRIIEVKDGRVSHYRGNYSDYIRQVSGEGEATPAPAKPAPRKNKKVKSTRKARQSQQPAQKQSGSKKKKAKPSNPWKVERLEKVIIALEEERGTLTESLAREAIYRDPNAAREIQFRLAEIERELEEKNMEWERRI